MLELLVTHMVALAVLSSLDGSMPEAQWSFGHARWRPALMPRWRARWRLDGRLDGSMAEARWLDADHTCGQPRWLDGRLDGKARWRARWRLDGASMAPRWLNAGAQIEWVPVLIP